VSEYQSMLISKINPNKQLEPNHWFLASSKVTKGSFVHLHCYSGVQFKAMIVLFLKRFLNVCICANVLE